MDPSPFASRIGTNYAATDEEIIQLTQLLSEPTSKLDMLQKEIDRVHCLLEDLSNRHEALSHEIENHRALMSPIRRLPVDVIQEIFAHCLPMEHNPIISRHECPILLTQICSGWRSIALSTASLWASIHIPIPVPTNVVSGYYTPTPAWDQLTERQPLLDAAKRRATAVKEWLGRSGACSLNITVYEREHSTPLEIYNIIIDAFIGLASRWGKISFETPAANLERIAALSVTDVPMLHSLSIRGRSIHSGFQPDPNPNIVFWSKSGILKAPRLRDISYSLVTENFTAFPLNWSQLTSISLHGIAWPAAPYTSISKIAWILESCPRLISCRLEVASLPNDSIQPYPRSASISLPYLRNMTIHAGRVDLSTLCEALDVPSLQQLEFHSSIYSSELPAYPLVPLLRRTATTMRSLAIDPHFLSKGDFFRCLQSCPHISTLSIQRSYYASDRVWTPMGERPREHFLDDGLLYRLTTPDDEGNLLCPELAVFECFIGPDFTDSALLDFIKAKHSRTPGLATVKTVAVVFSRPQEIPLLGELEPFMKDGLDCRLSYSPALAQGLFSASDGISSVYNDNVFYPWGAPTLIF
ncbi:hypothetical protein BDZ97DRAFT_1915951 [Flammula alnicola]|nr:hypothetical protein BDZ97DRAFT_1915951 [Flammula alnicola]